MSDQTGSSWEATRRAWEEVGRHFAEVGRRVEERYRTTEAGPKEAKPAEGGAEKGARAIGEALENVVRQLDQAFTSLGDTFRDPVGKESLQRAVRSFGDALETTFSTVGERLKGRKDPQQPSGANSPGDDDR